MRKNVNVSEWTLNKLKEIKKKEQHKSLDSVIRTLVLRYEKNQHV